MAWISSRTCAAADGGAGGLAFCCDNATASARTEGATPATIFRNPEIRFGIMSPQIRESRDLSFEALKAFNSRGKWGSPVHFVRFISHPRECPHPNCFPGLAPSAENACSPAGRVRRTEPGITYEYVRPVDAPAQCPSAAEFSAL